jgi:hypothetical protein
MRSRRPDSHHYALPGLQHFHFADNEGPATGHRGFSLICQMDTGNTTFRHVLLIMFFTFGVATLINIRLGARASFDGVKSLLSTIEVGD